MESMTVATTRDSGKHGMIHFFAALDRRGMLACVLQTASLLLFALALHAPFARAAPGPQFHFTTIHDAASDIRHSHVEALFQDRQGFVWIGTRRGLYRHDGYTLVLHAHDAAREDSLPPGVITAGASASDNTLWLGTRGWLLRYDPGARQVLQRWSLPGDGTPRQIMATDAGVWVAGTSGLAFLADTAGQLQAITLATSAGATSAVTQMARCPDGGLYAGGRTGLWAVTATSARRIGPAEAINGLACKTDGRLLASTDAAVVEVAADSGRRTTLWTLPADSSGTPSLMVAGADNQVWVGISQLGLLRLSPDAAALIKPDTSRPDSLPGTFFTELMVDRSGLVWLGLAHAGVAHLPEQASAIRYALNTNGQAGANDILAIFEDTLQQYWIGTRGAGLQQYLPDGSFQAHNDAIREALGLPTDTALAIHAIAPAAAGALWLATDHGVVRLDPAHRQARRIDLGVPSGARDRYRDIAVARDGSLWLAGMDNGLVHFMHGPGVIARYGRDQGLADDHVTSVAIDDKGRLWAGTPSGLSLHDPLTDSFRNFRGDKARDDGLSGQRILALQATADGTLLVASEGGVDTITAVDETGLRVRHMTSEQGADSAAWCVLTDRQGDLWIPRNRGITHIDASGTPARTLSRADGLPSQHFNPQACLQDSSGALWFGSTHGLIRIAPQRVTTSSYKAPVVITAISDGDGNPVRPDADQRMTVPRDAALIHIEFTSLDFARPAANRFSYRLVGLSPEWIDNGTERRVTFTNLPAGHYRFEVRGSNRDGVFNSDAAFQEFEVTVSWWQTTWAQLLAVAMVLLLAGLLALAWWRRQRTARQHARELRAHDQRLQLALWGSGDYFWDYDLQAQRIWRIAGKHPDQPGDEHAMSLDYWRHDFVHPDDVADAEARAKDHIRGLTTRFESVQRVRGKDNEWRWVRWRGQVVERDADGRALRMAGTTHDLEGQRAQEDRARIATLVLDTMTEAVMVTGPDFRILSVNPAFSRMVGYSRDEIVGASSAILDCDRHDAGFYRQVRCSIRDEGHWRGEIWQKRKDGSQFLSWHEAHVAVGDTRSNPHHVHVMTDITERKRAEQELRHLANHDPVTGLPNHTWLEQHLRQTLDRARLADNMLAVLLVNLAQFKQVNNSLGHAMGDRVLRATGVRLRGMARRTDTVARLGGDEFAVVLHDVPGMDEATSMASAIVRAFDNPLKLDEEEQILVTPSVGIALAPEHSSSAEELLRFAGMAMYQAKADGRNTWALYTAAMNIRVREYGQLIAALRRALNNHEFSLVFQPQLRLSDWRICGVEALLRWHSPSLGQVSPAIFVPLAEETGLVQELGDFVLNEACAVLARWDELGVRDVKMSINVASSELLAADYHKRVIRALSSHRVNAAELAFELTETQVMVHTDASLGNLHTLKALGARLAIDDFGTGYSSLAYLKSLPADILKIDKAFIDDLVDDPDGAVILATIIHIGHALGMEVIAEGAEMQAQVAFLKARGCDQIQGNWFSRPLSAADCLEFIWHHDPQDKPRFAAPTKTTGYSDDHGQVRPHA